MTLTMRRLTLVLVSALALASLTVASPAVAAAPVVQTVSTDATKALNAADYLTSGWLSSYLTDYQLTSLSEQVAEVESNPTAGNAAVLTDMVADYKAKAIALRSSMKSLKAADYLTTGWLSGYLTDHQKKVLGWRIRDVKDAQARKAVDAMNETSAALEAKVADFKTKAIALRASTRAIDAAHTLTSGWLKGFVTNWHKKQLAAQVSEVEAAQARKSVSAMNETAGELNDMVARYKADAIEAREIWLEAQASSPSGNPGNSKNCSDFDTWYQAQKWFNTYYDDYGDVANLDGDGDLIACEALPGAP